LAAVMMSGVTPYKVGGEGRAGAAHAALHFVENQSAPDIVAALPQRLQHRLADIVGAADALHRLDDDRGGVRSTNCSTAAGLSRGAKLTSKGARGKPYHFSMAPQVKAPAAAVRP
jgi:hypothetical protein